MGAGREHAGWCVPKTARRFHYRRQIAAHLSRYYCPAKSALSARKITALRQKLGLTKAALASRIGINVNTLWRWERGDRKPHGLHRKLIADLLRDRN